MDLWIQAHLLTEHPWDLDLTLEAFRLRLEADLREISQRFWREIVFGAPDPNAFRGLRAILDI